MLLDRELSIQGISYKQEGKFYLIRLTHTESILHVFGEELFLRRDCRYEYVKATIYVKEQCLSLPVR